MAGGHAKYRHLSRSSAHRQALLRNLVTSLITHESISTTWHKAKEAQRLAEKVITLSKRNTNAARIRVQQILFNPFRHMDRVFGELRKRYESRPGGYTRVLRTEPGHDQASRAILELVDGPKDMRFAMTARTLVRERALAQQDETKGVREITARNVLKVTRYRPNGQQSLKHEVLRLEEKEVEDQRVREKEAEARETSRQNEKAQQAKERRAAIQQRKREERSRRKRAGTNMIEEEDEEDEEEDVEDFRDEDDEDDEENERKERARQQQKRRQARLPFEKHGRKYGWERYDEHVRVGRRSRRLEYDIQDLRDQHAEKQRLKEAKKA